MSFRHATRTLGALAIAALLAPPLLASPASAQNRVLDEGTFLLYQNGRQIGSERFTIRRVGAGDEARIYAEAVIERDGASMQPVLELAAGGTPISYMNRLTGADVAEVAVEAQDRRYVAQIKSAAGESRREVRALPGSVFLEGDVAHQYHFLSGAIGAGGTVPVVLPRSGEQVQARVGGATDATVEIGSERVPARRVEVDAGALASVVWFDAQGRVLKVEIPARGFTAVRQSI